MAPSYERAELEGARWKAVRRGLRLARSSLGVGAIGLFYGLWCLIGLILCLVLIPFAVVGKKAAFEDALSPIALYGFLLPIALMAGSTWAVKLFSRLLWCAIPEPLTATFLAFAAVAGRLSVLFALGHLWLSGGPFSKGLLLPETMACAGIAWLGLVAEWGFIRTLRRDLIAAADPAPSSAEFDNAVQSATEAERVTGQNQKSILTRDFGEWFKRAFPRCHKLFVWILLPLAYVIVSSLANNGDPQAIPDAILKLAVIAPAFLQVLWLPRDEIDALLNALSQKTAQENLRSK